MHIQKPFVTSTPTLTILIRFILFLSILYFPACSSDENSGVQPNYIVQATISVENDGPVAFALVMDEDLNSVDTLNLTINGDPMSLEYLTNTEGTSTETGDTFPYYTMDLPDLIGGDTVVFEARNQFDRIIYAPEPAIIPMAIELLEPEEGQEIVAGDEVIIRWTGGEGAKIFSAAYAALEGAESYTVDVASDGESVTIPAGQTGEGDAVLGVGAISGEVQVISSFDENWLSYESFFLISREIGIITTVLPPDGVTTSAGSNQDSCKAVGKMPGVTGVPEMACGAQFAALGIGAIIWENRRQCDLNNPDNERCRKATTNFTYCVNYGIDLGHGNWHPGCAECWHSVPTNAPPATYWVGRDYFLPRPCKPGK